MQDSLGNTLRNVSRRAFVSMGASAITNVGTFSNELLLEATKNTWCMISMKNDWKRIFAWEQ